MSGTVRARLPFVPLSISPPGLGVVCRRTRPGPGVAVNVGAPDAGHLANPGCGAGSEDDDVTPAFEVVGRPGDERGGQAAERLPIGQRQ